MDLVVTLEHRFERTPDGAVWTRTAFPYSFWMPYLEVFPRVRAIARVREVPTVAPDWQRADGKGVTFAAVPYYIGPVQYLLRARQVKQAIASAVNPTDATILRVSSHIADDLRPLLRRTGKPYGVEVVADPYDVFAPGSVKHPLRPLLRWWSPRQLRSHCLEACAAAYVTESALQRRYPPGLHTFSTYYSDVELPQGAFVSSPRIARKEVSPLTLITVGTMAQLYKAPDLLIEAVAVCVREGLHLKLVLVGDGKHRAQLEAQAAQLGLAEQVCFKGWLPAGEAVRHQMDRADVFVLPSHQEGLPRAMVEAMARGLPCIGSTVGGIPELLASEDLVPPGNVAALAAKIRQVATNPARLSAMSVRNLEKAKHYQQDLLCHKRLEFYRCVRDKTEAWLRKQSPLHIHNHRTLGVKVGDRL
jgi:glycosyltransferase involved in cell wall biosynthesis